MDISGSHYDIWDPAGSGIQSMYLFSSERAGNGEKWDGKKNRAGEESQSLNRNQLPARVLRFRPALGRPFIRL
ncbi:hypothetical protein H6P81_011889 [Aristolochia fimbriata]|uniref:Ycf15 n=1 Tax=Aristolochia fimbriata TaxID=158543 RepID=A0AAV7EBI1_ARIFI|nr:hypothetical protein H6P81_011889 [Aristolochia fimbriata]